MADGGGKLRLINGALGLLAESPIVSLADVANTRIGRQINAVFDEVIAAKSASHIWWFMVEAQPLPATAEESPYDSLWRIYTPPNNILRVVSVLQAESQRVSVAYRRDKNGIHAPMDRNLVIVFMRETSPDNFPAWYSRYIQAALALEGASIANSNLVDAMQSLMSAREQTARTLNRKDSQGNEAQLFNCDDIINARFSDYDDFGDLRRITGLAA